MKTEVTRVESDSDDGGVWQLTIARSPVFSGNPDPRDVPGDIRRALRIWLDEARSSEPRDAD